MLVLFLLLHLVLGNDTPKAKFTIDNIDVCPDIGYYFKKESNPNALDESCHLCFCQNNGTAVCWPRDNRRCDKKHYYHAGRRKRDSRMRRSPGFSEIFFRDAARDVFNRQLPQQCKPYESSFSEGCPPADWCVGCTVCDCDANGRWDCHILSFCSDNKGKKQMRKRKGSLRNKVNKRQLTTKAPTTVTTKKSNKKPVNTNKNNKNNKNNQKLKPLPQKQNRKQMNLKNKKKVEMQKKKAPMNKPKISPQKKTFVTKKKTPVNKKNFQQNKKPNNPKNLNTKKSIPKKVNKNDTATIFAETIFKKVMASVEKILYESQKNASAARNNKIIQKRSMSKQVLSKKNRRPDTKSGMVNKINKKEWIYKAMKNKQNEKLGRNVRRKREISFGDDIQNIAETENITTLNPSPFVVQKMDHVERKYNVKNEVVLLNATPEKIDRLNYFHYTVVSNVINDINKLTTTKPSNQSDDSKTTMQITKIINSNKNLSTDAMDIPKTSKKLSINETQSVNKTERSKKNLMEGGLKTNITCGKICKFRNYFSRKAFDFSNNISTVSPKIKKKNNILHKLKMFLAKIFKKTPNKTTRIDKSYFFRKHSFIKILCKNINSCKYNASDKLLHSKLNQLKVESNRIIKSVKIIKGLLKLLSFNKLHANGEKEFINTDEQILTAILKDEYEAFLLNVTETQRIQIRYVKENTLVFIESIENFANILSDLVDILNKKYNRKKDFSRRHLRCLRRSQNFANNKDPMSPKLEKLKKLLKSYNLVQNKFMKQMYEAISSLNSTRNMAKPKELPKVSFKSENKNNSFATDIYLENIVKNLRKLKDLAQKLSSKKRSKRSASDDDHAVEYLLTLMEYILKQNRRMSVAPAKDGIDLIIEAIKNAPDVKPVKKKVLDYTSTTDSTTSSLSKVNGNNNSNNIQETSNKFKTFESMDNDESEEPADSHSNNVEYKETDVSKNLLTPEVESKIDLNKESYYNIEKTTNKIGRKQKFEIFFDDDDDIDVENVTMLNAKGTEPVTSTESNRLPTRTLNVIDRNSHKIKGKPKLDWVDENLSNEKRIDVVTEKILKVTRTVNQKEKHAKILSSMTEESLEKNDKIKVSSDEVYKRQMNLFNTLDYGTERSPLDSDSKEDKYNVETFPMYFA